jgi:biotin carboxylase
MLSGAESSGIPVPRTRLLHGAVDLLCAAEELSMPLVVKPRLGSAAVGVRILRDADDLRAVLSVGLLPAAPRGAPDLIAQEFIAGDMFHVDGLMQDGRILLDWPSRYSTGVAESVRPESVVFDVQLPVDDPRTPVLRHLAADVVRALPATPDPTAFHLEAWIADDGRPTFCEIACRPGGGPVIPLFEAAFGVNLSEANYRGQAALPLTRPSVSRPADAAGGVIVSPGVGEFTPPSTRPDDTAFLELGVAPGERRRGPRFGGDSAMTAVVLAATHQSLVTRLDAVAQWWRAEAQWS